MPATPLEVRNLTKSFGERRALDGVSLDLAPGEILGLLGPNGAGKTTLVRSVAGRAVPEGGTLRILGFEPADDRARAVRGWVPQEIALYSLLSPRENLWTFGRYQGLWAPPAGRRDPDEPRLDRPGRPRRREDGQALGRHEAEAEHRLRDDPRSRGSCFSTSRRSASTRSRASASTP